MGDGEQTTLRKFDRELGQHDARLDSLEKRFDHVESKMDDQHTIIMGALSELKEDRAKSAGRQQMLSAGGGLAAGGLMTWLLKQLGV